MTVATSGAPRRPRSRLPFNLRPDLGLGREVGFIFWAHLFCGAGFGLQTALWTLFIDDLGASPQQIGLVLGVTSGVRAILMLPAGALSDRISTRWMASSTMSLAAFGALALVAADVWWHALVGAILIDMSALSMPSLAAHITASTTQEQRTKAFAYTLNIAFTAPMIVFPALAGWIASTAGFGVVFTLAAVLYGTSAAMFLGLRATPTHVDATSVQEAGALVVLHADGSSSTAPVSTARGTYRGLFREPWVMYMLMYQLMVAAVLWLGFQLVSNYLVDEHDYSLSSIGSIASLAAVAGLSWGLLAGHWKPLSNPMRAMTVTLAFAGISSLLFLSSGWLPVVAVAWMLRSCFANIWAMMAAALSEVTPQRLRARSFAAAEISIGVGDAAAPLGAGMLYAFDRRLPMVATLLATPPMLLAAFIAARRHAANRAAAHAALIAAPLPEPVALAMSQAVPSDQHDEGAAP